MSTLPTLIAGRRFSGKKMPQQQIDRLARQPQLLEAVSTLNELLL
jgi:hypothetical protein